MSEKKIWDVLQKLRETCYASEENIRTQLHLTYAEYFALGSMRAGEKVTCQELADRMQLSLSRCSRIVDRLFAKEFLDRVDCSSDRRCKSLSLTAKGADTKSRIDALRNECETRLATAFPGKKLEVLLKELEDLIQKMEEGIGPEADAKR